MSSGKIMAVVFGSLNRLFMEEEAMTEEKVHPEASQPIWVRPLTVTVLVASLFGLGLTACGDDVEDVTSFAEYIGASADVLDANGMEPEANLDCDGNTETNQVTCTGTTTDGLSIESTGENLGEDTATLVVTVDGEILYDGLLDEAP